MHLLSTTFNILSVCGCWKPTNWSTVNATLIYNIYAAFVILVLHTFTFSQLMDIVLNVDNTDDFTDNIYTFLALMLGCCKMVSLLANKRAITALMNAFEEEPFRVETSEERQTQNKYDQLIRSATVCYTCLVETTVFAFAVTSYFMNFRKNRLAFRAWLPYDLSTPGIFVFTYIHQLFGWTVTSLINVATDALIGGLLIHSCCQFDIFKCRLKQIKCDQKKNLRKCIHHHGTIYKFAQRVNETFRTTMCIQFLVSTLVVCFILCQLVKIGSLNSVAVQLVLYMCCMMSQIFLYCWCGNEVKLKSLEVTHMIFEADWLVLNQDSKRSLLMIMRRARIPIELTSGYVIGLNLNSFVRIIKSSYSAYNLLQRTQ